MKRNRKQEMQQLNEEQKKNYLKMYRLAKRKGGRFQFSAHGVGKFSVQIFKSGKLLSDCNL